MILGQPKNLLLKNAWSTRSIVTFLLFGGQQTNLNESNSKKLDFSSYEPLQPFLAMHLLQIALTHFKFRCKANMNYNLKKFFGCYSSFLLS